MPREIFSSTNHKHTVARWDKTRPRIQKHFPESKINAFQNPKTLHKIRNTSQIPKTRPEFKTRPKSKNTSQNPKHVPESKTLPRIQNTSIRESKSPCNNPTHVPKTKNTFGFWEVFWFRGHVFGFWEVFWILERVFGFWDVFWILWSVFFILGRVMDSEKCFVPIRHGTNTTQIKAVTRVTVMICIPL